MLAAVALPAGAAAAGDPTEAQYDPTVELITQTGGGTGDPGQVGGLPFTGFDVAGLLAVGACLAAAGFFLYRRSRDHGQDSATP